MKIAAFRSTISKFGQKCLNITNTGLVDTNTGSMFCSLDATGNPAPDLILTPNCFLLKPVHKMDKFKFEMTQSYQLPLISHNFIGLGSLLSS